MKKKKVLIFALTYYPKFVGGDGVAVKEVTDRISSDEIEFHMVTLRLDKTLPKYEQFGNVHIHRVGFSKSNPTPEELVTFPMYLTKVFFPISAFFKALSLHKKYKFDLLWGMMVYAGFPIVFFNFFKKKVPILLTLQDGDPIETIVGRGRIKVVLPLFKRIFKIPKHLQSISIYLENFAKDMGYTGPTTIVPNGVDYLKFATSDEERVKELRSQFVSGATVTPAQAGVQDDHFILFTASRLVTKNANDVVIKALAKLPKNVKFIIAGLGPDREMLEELAEKEGVKDRAVFVGHIQHADLPNYLKASDAFIRPSRTEGFGNSFVEAMAAGIPVIATTAGGIKDFLFDGETGFEVGIESVDDIVRQTYVLMEGGEKVEKVVEKARAMARDTYDWEVITKQMKEVFEKSF